MNENTMNNDVTIRPQAGSSLGCIDQYELIRELGGGGFGCVYLARDTVAGIEVAVKGLPPLVRLNKEELENVRQNFALVSRLYHPNIAAALHFQKVQSAVYNDEDVKEKLSYLPVHNRYNIERSDNRRLVNSFQYGKRL